MIQNQ